jgi:hypothetical protein
MIGAENASPPSDSGLIAAPMLTLIALITICPLGSSGERE